MFRRRLMILVLLAFIISPFSKAFATDQIPETLVYKGEKIELYDVPLDSLFSDQHKKPDFYKLTNAGCSGEWRGYHGTWEVREGDLYLVDLQGPCSMSVDSKLLLNAIFSDVKLPVKAIWLTGSIHALQNNKMLELQFDKGKLIKEEVKDWPPSNYNYQLDVARNHEYWAHEENARKANEQK
ncbi:MAG: hypothetical protein WCI27_05185 [Candidatus Omnitrophota bacterium]